MWATLTALIETFISTVIVNIRQLAIKDRLTLDLCFSGSGWKDCNVPHVVKIPSSTVFLLSPSDDHSRVHLSSLEGVPDSDFINASFINVCISLSFSPIKTKSLFFVSSYLPALCLLQGYQEKNKFIAAQGKLCPCISRGKNGAVVY